MRLIRGTRKNMIALNEALHYINEAQRTLKEEDEVLTEDELFEDDDDTESSAEQETEKKMTEEELKIESLKIATNIGKLMSDVTPSDIIEISSAVADFIRNHEIGSESKDNDSEDLESNEDEEESEDKE